MQQSPVHFQYSPKTIIRPWIRWELSVFMLWSQDFHVQCYWPKSCQLFQHDVRCEIQEELHEIKSNTSLSWPETMFLVFGIDTEVPQIRWELWFCILWKQDLQVHFVWPKWCQFSQYDLIFKRNLTWNRLKSCTFWIWYETMSHVVYWDWNLSNHMRALIFNLWSHYFCVYCARPKSCQWSQCNLSIKRGITWNGFRYITYQSCVHAKIENQGMGHV